MGFNASDPQPGQGIFTNPKPGAAGNVFTAAGLFLATTWITLSLRIWVRVNLAKSFGWDDAILLLSALTFTGFCAVIILAETIGGGPHVNDLAIPALRHTVGMVVSTFGLYIATMIIFKISLGIFYLRFVIRPWQRYVVYTAVAVNTLYGLLLFFVAIFQCGNPTLYLDNELKNICMPIGPLYAIQLGGAITNALTDWTLAILPIFVLVKANMPKSAKITAGFILLLGCSGSIISLIRIQYIKDLRPSPDFFRGITDIAIWSIAECGICISAAAAAALRPLFRGLMERTGVSISNVFSFGSRMKSLQGNSSNARQSETLFGDWGTHTARHRMADIEIQREEHTSVSPAMHNYRVLSKMGLSKDDLRDPPPLPEQAATTVSKDDTQTKPTRKGRSDARKNDQRGQDRPEISRKQSIRDKMISRPLPRNSSPIIAPPTPTFGARPQRVMKIDARRRGSPDWGSGGHHPELSRSAYPKSPLSQSGNPF